MKRYSYIEHDSNGTPAQRLRIPTRIFDNYTHDYWCYLPEITDLLNDWDAGTDDIMIICCKNQKEIEKFAKELLNNEEYSHIAIASFILGLRRDFRRILSLLKLKGHKQFALKEDICGEKDVSNRE